MRGYQRYLAFIALFAVILAACGSSAPTTGGAAPSAGAAAPAAAAPPEKAPEAVEQPAPQKAAPAKKAPKFLVQVGVFSDPAKAEELKKDLDSAETIADVRKVEVAGKTMYRVLIGPSRGRADAQALAEKLKKLGYPGLLHKE